MKMQCDVCGHEEASVFCTADEAALCQNCDNRVHNANKLANKHPRFSIAHPQLKESPLCDICQLKRAFVFCQEDRSLLCRECDIPIHKTNEYTKKHNRFLLTGVKISVASPSNEAASSSQSGTNFQQNSTPNCSEESSTICQQGSVSTSSISEYLMETLPGWQVEDFLDPSS